MLGLGVLRVLGRGVCAAAAAAGGGWGRWEEGLEIRGDVGKVFCEVLDWLCEDVRLRKEGRKEDGRRTEIPSALRRSIVAPWSTRKRAVSVFSTV